MVEVVVVGGTQIRAHAAVVAGDDHAAAAGGLRRIDAVLDTQTGLLDGILEDGGVLVVADTPNVHDAVGRQHVLRSTGCVLCGTAGEQLRLIVVQEILVKAEVLLLCQDGIVGLEAILLKQLCVAKSLDVLKRAVSYQGCGEEGSDCPQRGTAEWFREATSMDETHRGEGSPDRAGGSPWKCSSCSMGVSWMM